MLKRRMARVAAAGLVGAAALMMGVGPVSAHERPRAPRVSDPIATGLAGPLQFEVSNRGDVLVAQSFSGVVSRITHWGQVKDLFSAPGVDGVAAGPFGSTIYTYTDHPETGQPQAQLKIRSWSGQVRTLADLYAHEMTKNPDRRQTYGLMGLSAECAAQLPPDQGLLPYKGIVDSHPYAVTPVFGGVLVADAGANAILFVNWRGHVSTVAVLPAQKPVPVSAEAAAANGLPPCVAGSSYVAEPVPTDVEVGRHGMLYVSTLPGGPEDPSLGARGGVYSVNMWNGRTRQVAAGFAGAANLAVSPRGDIYVSELFGNKVSKVVGNHGVTVANVPTPSGLEWSNGRLYAGINTFGPEEAPPDGQIVTIKP
ncbi:MAG: ScyD/ScyE family protein [Microthrixaceae bacterium]